MHPRIGQGSSKGDLIAFVGAGDIDHTAPRLHRRSTGGDRACPTMGPICGGGRTALVQGRQASPGGTSRVKDDHEGRKLRAPLCRAGYRRGCAGAPGEGHAGGRPGVRPGSGVELDRARRRSTGSSFRFPRNIGPASEALPDGRVRVGAGLRLKNLCGLAAAAGLGGFEFLEGIPGSVGGALRVNAGAMGGWMFDVVDQVCVMSMEGEVRNLPRSAMNRR